MRVPAEINSQALAIPKIPTGLIIIGKLGLWLSLTLVIFYFLFNNIAGQFPALFSNSSPVFNFKFLHWIVLAVCLTALWLTRKTVWQIIRSDCGDSQEVVHGLVNRILGLDFILTALLVLIAYPLPPAPDFLIFRLLTAALAGFVLVFGRKAAFVPSVVIATYGISLLSFSGLSSLVA